MSSEDVSVENNHRKEEESGFIQLLNAGSVSGAVPAVSTEGSRQTWCHRTFLVCAKEPAGDRSSF